MITKTNCLIHREKIYPVDSVIQLLNNWSQMYSYDYNTTSTRIQSFLKPYVFYPNSCGRGLINRSGERFQNNAVLVTGFTGFMWTKFLINGEKYAVSEISGFVWTWPKEPKRGWKLMIDKKETRFRFKRLTANFYEWEKPVSTYHETVWSVQILIRVLWIAETVLK